jgi:tryptophan-rich sensory protein
MKKFIKLLICIIVCQAAGGIGAIFTMPAISGWYRSLQKPFFNPPDWIFSPVWIFLFLLMGISLYLVWDRGARENKKSIFIFGVQLVLNIFWSIIFFGLKSPGFAFLEIIILWLAILATIISFYKISKTAGLLLIPYILWVSFALILNLFLWRLN